MKKHLILLLIPALITNLMITGCGKSKWQIGQGAPQAEIAKCMKLSENKQFEEAIECLEVFKSRFPQTPFSREAELSIADNYFNQKEYLLAADSYMMFVKMHPTSSKIDYAYYRLGLSYLKETPKTIDRDQQYLDKAIHYLRITVATFQGSEYHEAAVESLKDARGRVAKRNYYIGRFYYRTGQYLSAILRFLDVVNDFPESELVPEALYKLVISSGKLQRTSESKLFYSKLEMEYPNSKWTERAEKKLTRYIKKYGDKLSPLEMQPPAEGGTQ